MPQLSSFNKVVRIVDEFRKLDPRMQAQVQQVFLDVVMHPDSTIGDVAKRINVSSASASRNVLRLGDGSKVGDVATAVEGLKVLTVRSCPHDARAVRVNLSSKGELVAKAILSIINDA